MAPMMPSEPLLSEKTKLPLGMLRQREHLLSDGAEAEKYQSRGLHKSSTSALNKH